MSLQKIKSIAHLKELADNETNSEGLDVVLLLNAGCRSSKRIRFFKEPEPADNDVWSCYEIDDTAYETAVFSENDYVPIGQEREALKVHWEIVHEIDGTWCEYTNDVALANHSNIVNGIKNNALLYYPKT